MAGLEQKAVTGASWTVLTFASGRLITVATTIALARLLAPADFGLIALATIALQSISLFGDLGLGSVLVVRENLDEKTKRTVFGVLLALGLAITALVAATAPLVAWILGDSRLTAIVAVLGLTAAFGATSSFYEAVLQRELEFSRRFRCQMLRGLSYAVVAITAAAAGAGVWSLVAGQLTSAVVYSISLLIVAPYRVRPAIDRGVGREALRDGRGFVAQSALGFVELNVDTVAVGRFLGVNQLGFYAMAFRMGELPYWAITESVAKVTFPGFARMRARGDDVSGSYLSVLGLVTLVACPAGALLSATADPFTRMLFGEAWLPMIAPLAVLGIWGTINHVEASLGWLLNSTGGAGANAMVSAVALVALVPGVVIAATWGDTATVAWVAVGHVVVSTAARAVLVRRRLQISFVRQWRAIRAPMAGVVASWLAARAVATTTMTEPAAVSLAASVVAGAFVYGVVVVMVDPGTPRRAIRQLRRTLRPTAEG